jgi:hypothetical protein
MRKKNVADTHNSNSSDEGSEEEGMLTPKNSQHLWSVLWLAHLGGGCLVLVLLLFIPVLQQL